MAEEPQNSAGVNQFTQFREPAAGIEDSSDVISQNSEAFEGSSAQQPEPQARGPPLPPSPLPPQPLCRPTAIAPAAAQVMAYTPLPMPGTQGSPNFDKTNATRFLRQMRDMCQRSGINTTEAMMSLIPQYCSDMTRVWVERRPSWISRNWSEFEADFLDYFYDGDSDQLRYTQQYLDSLSRVHRDIDGDNRDYLDEFNEISGELVQRGELGDCDRADMLIRGLPEKWKLKIAKYRSAKDFPRHRRITYAEAYGQEGSQRGNNQSHQQGQHGQPTQPAPSGGLERQVQEIQTQMAALALKVQAHQDPRADPRYEPTRRGPTNGLGIGPPIRCYTCGGLHRSRSDSCPTIRELQGQGMLHFNANGRMVLGTHDQPGPEVRVHPEVLHMDSIRRQYDEWKRGPPPRPNPSVPTAFAAAPVQSVDASLNGIPGSFYPPRPSPQHYPYDHPGPAAPVSFASAVLIGSSFAWEKLDEDEDEYDFDTPAIGVNSADTRGSKRRREHGENSIARTKSAQTGRFQPRVEEILDDDVMQDGSPEPLQAPPIAPQVVQPRRVRGPTDPIVAQRRTKLSDMVLRKIWETNITLSIGELLGAAPRLRAGVGKDVTLESINQRISDMLTQAQVNSASTCLSYDIDAQIAQLRRDIVEYHHSTGSPVNEEDLRASPVLAAAPSQYQGAHLIDDLPPLRASLRQPREYSRELLYVNVMVGGVQIKACIDTGSAVNIIRKSLVDEISLQVRLAPRLKLLPVDGRDYTVYGCVESLPVNIGDIVTESHTMIGDKCTNELLLGRLWAKDAMLQTSERPDGRVICKVYSSDRMKYTTFEAYSPEQGGSFYEDQLWPESASALNVKQGP
ncbi:hypothetical protein N7535_001703 [Penicillium sp. DV-2018c]|nr:hypothetical protein N7535_001703 [Penicillium sp. DV-2018c]